MKNLVTLLALIAVLTITLVTTGCGGGGSQDTPSSDPTIPASGVVVTNNIEIIRAWSDIQAMPRNTQIWVRLSRQGTEVREYPATFIAAKTEFGENLISCVVPANVAIGPGDSGSPIGWVNPQTKHAEIIGMLCYGSGSIGDNSTFKARYIYDVTSVADRSRAIELQSQSGFVPIANIQFLTGTSQAGLDRLAKAGFKTPAGVRATASSAKVRGGGPTPVINRIAGMKLSVNDISGDVFTAGAIGTIGYVTAGQMFIFGHAYEKYGEVDIPATLADMTYFTSGITPFVDATPMLDQPLGSVVKDYSQGCMISRGKTADTITVTLHDKMGNTNYDHGHAVARSSNSFKENYYICLATASVVDFDRAKYAKGTVTGSITLTYSDGTTATDDLACSDDSDVVYALFRQMYDILDGRDSSKTLKSVDVTVEVSDAYTAPVGDEG